MDFTEYLARQRAIRSTWSPLKRFFYYAKIFLASPQCWLAFACCAFAVFVNVHTYHYDKWVDHLKSTYPSTTNVSKQKAIVNQMYIDCANNELHQYSRLKATQEKIEAIPQICLQNLSNINSLKDVSQEDFSNAIKSIKVK